uniref:Uncharacterized protein n=1 Tax=Caenorhabditis japonica TaxID=281687 RepID=A0A8R1DTJ6_CAEJA
MSYYCIIASVFFPFTIRSRGKLISIASTSNIRSISPKICEQYELVEQKFKCGAHGYALNYGLRNCLVFTNETTLKKFTPKGQQFVGCSTRCLVSAILNISQFSTSCAQIQEEAFKSHVDCYLNCGFCEVCKTEKLALLKSYEWTDFLSFAAAQQVFAIIRKCGLFTCFK